MGLFDNDSKDPVEQAAEDMGAQVVNTPKVGEMTEPLAVVSLDVTIKGYNAMWVLKDVDELNLAKRLEDLLITFEARDDIQPYQRYGKSKSKGSSGGNGTQGSSESFHCKQFVLQKRTDGKMELQMYPMLGDGSIGQYSECTYVGDRDKMWDMAGHVLKPYNLSAEDLPAKRECSWLVEYTYGKPTGKTDKQGNATYYRDLQSISQVD